jgi:hypothetical protein
MPIEVVRSGDVPKKYKCFLICVIHWGPMLYTKEFAQPVNPVTELNRTRLIPKSRVKKNPLLFHIFVRFSEHLHWFQNLHSHLCDTA